MYFDGNIDDHTAILVMWPPADISTEERKTLLQPIRRRKHAVFGPYMARRIMIL